MDIILLMKSIMGLVVILGILIMFFLYTPTAKKKKLENKKKSFMQESKAKPKHELKDLLEVIRNNNSTTEQLAEALDAIIKYHGHIHPKLGIRSHPDFDIYSEILLRICRHPSTTKEIIIKFDKALEKKNPEYIREINDSLTKGLNSRGM